MHFERIKTPGLGHIAYIIAENGAAAIVDPCRDVDRYLKVLHENGLRLRYVIETHRQEDFEMGGASLRDLTGARIVACDHQIMAHADCRLQDGDTLTLDGGITFTALHTPGHTPESMCYAVTLAEAPGCPWGVFSGDALFIGDTGRTDLVDPEQTAMNAGLLHDRLHERVFPLGDQTLVLPAHGAGSACGGNVADRDESTIGVERVSNAAALMSRHEFISHKLDEKLSRPPYFRLMEKVNRNGGRPFDSAPAALLLPDAFGACCRDSILFDTRDAEAFAGGHVPGSYSIWLDGLARYGGWFAEAATPVCLVADGPDAVEQAHRSLGRIGCDNLVGALAGGFRSWRDGGFPIATSGTVSAADLADRLSDFVVLDVREQGEYDDGHIPNALHMPVGRLEAELASLDLDPSRNVVVTCSIGQRGSLGVSVLRRCGFDRVFNLLGGMSAWRKPNPGGNGRSVAASKSTRLPIG